LVGLIVGALEGALVVGGLSALGVGLVSLGVPHDSVVQYETALKAGKFVLIAQGTADLTAQARKILERSNAHSIEHHQADLPAHA